MPERGLRESEDNEPPYAATAYVAGERLATDKGILGIRCREALPPKPLPSYGEGEDAEGGILPESG